MLMLMSYLNNDPHLFRYIEYYKIDTKKNEISGFYGTREKLTVLDQISEPTEFLQSILILIAYMHDLHVNKKLFHGDIKPANIFVSLSNQMMTTDSGSLIPLYSTDNQAYYTI